MIADGWGAAVSLLRRPVTWVVAAVLLAAVAAATVTSSFMWHPRTPEYHHQQDVRYAAAVAAWEDYHDVYAAGCAEGEADGARGLDYTCDTSRPPTWEEWNGAWGSWLDDAVWQLGQRALLIAAAAFVVGASAVRGVLTWRVGVPPPVAGRSTRAFATTIVAGACAAALVSAVAAAVCVGSLAVTYAHSGQELGVTWASVGALVAAVMRTVLMGVLAGAAGAVVTVIVRRVLVAAVAVVFVAFCLQMVVVVGPPWLQQISIVDGPRALVDSGTGYAVQSCSPDHLCSDGVMLAVALSTAVVALVPFAALALSRWRRRGA